MDDALQALQVQLPETSGEDRLELLIRICEKMCQLYAPGVESYLEEALLLAEKLDALEKKIILLHHKGQVCLLDQKYELAGESYQQALKTSKEIKNPKLLVLSLRGIGRSFIDDAAKSIIWYEKALKEAKENGIIEEEVWAYIAIGSCYHQQMHYDKCINQYLKAIRLAKELQNQPLLGICYFNFALVSDDESGIQNLKKSIEIFESINNKSVVVKGNCLLSEKYLKTGELIKSKQAVDKAIKLAEATKSSLLLYKAYYQKTAVLLKLATDGNDKPKKPLLKEAEKFCAKAINAVSQNDKEMFYYDICLKQAEIHYHLEDYQKALLELTKVDSFLAKNKNLTHFTINLSCSKYLYKTYAALKDFEKAFHHHLIFVEWDNKIKNTTSVNDAKAMQIKYEAREKEAELKRMQEIEEIKNRFFSQITHELRTPLSLIVGPAGLIPKTDNKKEVNQHAQIIERNANRLLLLVNQLLDVNKLEAGKMPLKKSKGAFPEFVESILNAFQNKANQKQIQLDFINNIDELFANFDADKIEKILYNLLSNAFKFTPSNGQIICQLSQLKSKNSKKTNIQISLSDSGRGISEKDIPNIFDRFYQADNSYTREAEGTGIGLSLVKELVELMNGKIELTSKLGAGSTFTIWLPFEIVEEELLPEINYEISQELQGLQDRKIPTEGDMDKSPSKKQNTPVLLLIEDNLDMHAYIKSILQEEYIILEAFDGKKGIEIALERIPDLILSDVMMPEKDGYQVCTELKTKQQTSHIPFVLLTAKAALKSRLEGLEHGADAYLTKPFNADELKLQLKNLLATQSNLQKKYVQLNYHKSHTKKLNKEERFLIKVQDLINENIEDENLNVKKLSELMFLSDSQLYRKIHALTKLSTSAFIRNFRLAKGKSLLEEKNGNVSEVAYKIGLSPHYFSKCFIKKYGISPKSLLKDTREIK